MDDLQNTAQQLNLDTSRKTAVLFTNVLWDTSIYRKDVAFANMLDWISETIRFFNENPEHNLIIRNRQFNNEVQHLGKQKGKCYPK